MRTMTTQVDTRVGDHDGGSDLFGVLVGSGVVLMQACALIPGLFPTLLLAGVLAAPLLVPAVPFAVLWLLWLLVRAVVRVIASVLPRGDHASRVRARGPQSPLRSQRPGLAR
jgi:hypothetical protein